MLESNGCKEYKEKNPSALEAEISLHGAQTTNENKQNWLERITQESVQNRSIL